MSLDLMEECPTGPNALNSVQNLFVSNSAMHWQYACEIDNIVDC